MVRCKKGVDPPPPPVRISWSYCFICSSKTRKSKEGHFRNTLNRGHQALLKCLLKDPKLERSLSRNLVQFVNHHPPEESLGSEGGGSSSSSCFDMQFCSKCDKLGETLLELEAKLEAIQRQMGQHLRTMREGILSSSRLYGGDGSIQERFQSFEHVLTEKELVGGVTHREREFLELLHQFQTFVFENAEADDKPLAHHTSLQAKSATEITSIEAEDHQIHHTESLAISKQGDQITGGLKKLEQKEGHQPPAPLKQDTQIQLQSEKEENVDDDDDPFLNFSWPESGQEEEDGDPTFEMPHFEEEPEDTSDSHGSDDEKGVGTAGTSSSKTRKTRNSSRLCQSKITKTSVTEKTGETRKNSEKKSDIGTISKPYSCKVCKKSYGTHLRLQIHNIYMHNYPTLFTCDLCPEGAQYSCKSKSTYGRHQFVAHGVGKLPELHKCTLCSRSYNSKANLRKHIDAVHDKPRPVSDFNALFRKTYEFIYQRNAKGERYCTVCEKPFKAVYTLSSHYVEEHNYPLYECDKCPDKKFPCLRTLYSHMLNHYGARQYQCSMCPKKYRHRYRMEEHELTHKSAKTFTCDLCGFCTKTRSLLKSHMPKHIADDEKKWLCTYCPMRFGRKSSLNVHLRLHTGEKPAKCRHCDDSFPQWASLKRHMLKHHADKVQKENPTN